EKFFGGNLTDWRTRGPGDASIRKLADKFRAGRIRGFSASNLSRFVSVVEIDARVGVSTWKHLGVTHVRTVLTLPEADQKRLLARAEEQDWPVVKLLDEVAKTKKKDKDPGDLRGRPPLPTWVKGMTQLKKGLALTMSEPATPDDFETYSPLAGEALLEEVEHELKSFQDFAGEVRTAIKTWKASMS